MLHFIAIFGMVSCIFGFGVDAADYPMASDSEGRHVR